MKCFLNTHQMLKKCAFLQTAQIVNKYQSWLFYSRIYTINFITKLLLMQRNQSVSAHKPKRCASSPSHHSHSQFVCKTISRKNSTKMAPRVSDWTQILNEIVNVTDRVRKLCKDNHKNLKVKANRFIRSRPQNKSMVACENEEEGERAMMPVWQQERQTSMLGGEQVCNYKCHQLMYECMKLNKQNKKLKQQKQSLQKRLYFESKQKKELRWKLEKQSLDKSKYCTNESNYNSFTLALSTHNLDIPKTHDHKFPSPLQQLSYQHPHSNIQPIKNNNNKSDSLLLDFEIKNQSSRNKQNSKADHATEEMLTEKTVKSITLQKDFNQLLEICKLETDGKKKKIIRKQMKLLAEELKSLRLQ